MLYPKDRLCPCGSGEVAGRCCLPEHPPISVEGTRFESFNIDAVLVDSEGRQRPLPKRLTPHVTFLQPYQQEPDIEEIAKGLIGCLTPPRDLDPAAGHEWIHSRGRLISLLADALYAVRYHQRQFLFRLGKVTSQQTFAFKPPTGNAVIRLADRPLTAELEAFLIRVAGALDALATCICMLLERNSDEHGTYGKLQNLLKKDRGLAGGAGARVSGLLGRNSNWIEQVRTIRNDIVHDASFEAFRGVGHEGTLLLDATIDGMPAGGFSIRVWKELRTLSRDLPTCFNADETRS